MSNQIHRDIYSGMVAEELNKEGYFGREVSVYAFYVWKDGTADIHYFTEEDDAVREMVKEFNAGHPVSDAVVLRERLEGAPDDDSVPSSMYTRAMVKLMKEQQITLQAAIIRSKAPQTMEKNDAVRKFVRDLDACGTDAREGVLAAYRAEGLIGLVPFAGLRNEVALPEQAGRRVSGFAWMEEGTVKTYVNAYLPTVWQKWREKQRECLVAPITTKVYEDDQTLAYALKEDFDAVLLKVYTKSFFAGFRRLFTE